ncbi:helix-turn-helix transcriptional regulator [Amycolatopsis sp. MEPSY49]|uniref:helix-turn-helix transcriptional regulator n=1 Tax=Amycolatopsis sp. MEPSY49 TaxID=3151600 RepID=UPI003EF8BDF7
MANPAAPGRPRPWPLQPGSRAPRCRGASPAALGRTPGAYLTAWRIDLAAARLRDTDDTVEAVAAAVGYTSPHAFSRAFRRARGSAPSEFRFRTTVRGWGPRPPDPGVTITRRDGAQPAAGPLTWRRSRRG